MHETSQEQPHTSFFADAMSMVLAETAQLLSSLDGREVKPAVDMIFASSRVFVCGAGRSGLALRMGAMRLMHLGLTVYVAGDTTTPAIAAGDLLIAASASGTSASVVHAAQVARKAGARVLAVTTDRAASLGTLADGVITLKAAAKNQEPSHDEHGTRPSQQYAGSLFEQSVVLLFDAIFQGAWRASGVSAEQLMKRHANLE